MTLFLAALLAIPAAIAAISIGQFVRHLITWWDGVVRLHHRLEEIRHDIVDAEPRIAQQ